MCHNKTCKQRCIDVSQRTQIEIYNWCEILKKVFLKRNISIDEMKHMPRYLWEFLVDMLAYNYIERRSINLSLTGFVHPNKKIIKHFFFETEAKILFSWFEITCWAAVF